MRTFDVVIIGGGIAGGFLTRQLLLARPGISILTLEAKDVLDDYKVGESTVEVAANYMVRKLNLSTYLYQHQLPKNGLRFFFDNEEKSLPITEMSEIGSDHMPYHPSFQLERARLERDLVEMNRAGGAEVLTGAKVVDISIEGDGPHTVVYEHGERHEVSARWVVDASGRRMLLVRKLGIKVQRETRINTAAAWGRYRNVAGLDAISDPAWRARVRYTSRHLSTNHFMYDGYWIWFIPLAGDLMSVGVVYDKDRIRSLSSAMAAVAGQESPDDEPRGPRGKDEFEAFLRSHRACRDLMEGAIFEDYQGYAHLPYTADTFFSERRFGITGEAGAFVDPFYSPGSDFIATSNEFLTSLILTDMEGDKDRLKERAALYNAFFKLKYEATLRLYQNLYPSFGSYEIFRVKYLLDFNNYYNLVVWPFMADKLTDPAWLKEEIGFGDFVLRAQDAIRDVFVRWVETLRARGRYFEKNAGEWANGLNGVEQFQQKLGPNLDDAFRKRELDRAYSSVFISAVESVLGAPGLSGRRRVLDEMSLPHVVMLKELKPTTVAQILKRVSVKLSRDLKAENPGLGIDKVTLDQDESGALRVRVLGPVEASPEHVRVMARAKEMWDETGQSLTEIRM